MVIDNAHERELPAPAAEVGRLIDRIGAPGDPLWPSPTWPPMRLDRPLAVGADGGHGPVRYHVTRYFPGRLVEFAFRPEIGLTGTHTLEVIDGGPRTCLLRHRLSARPTGVMRLLWPLVVGTCHDTVLEHLLDNAEHAVTGTVARPVRYPPRARLVVAMKRGRVRSVPVPPGATLLHSAGIRTNRTDAADLTGTPDLMDAFAVRVPPGTSTDPVEWAHAVFRRPPRAVTLLLRLRNALVVPFGITRGRSSVFDPMAGNDREVLVGADAAHLDFRASVLVEPLPGGTRVTVSTVAAARNRTGRWYLAVVRLVHPAVVKAMLRRAARAAVAPHPLRTGRQPTRR